VTIIDYGDADTRRKALEGAAEGLSAKPIDFGVAQRDRHAGSTGRIIELISVLR